MQLEEIYEAQLFPQQTDELNKAYQKTLQSLNATGLSFTALKMKIGEQAQKARVHADYYQASIHKIELIEMEFHKLLESYNDNFIKHPYMNHPNLQTRRDIV